MRSDFCLQLLRRPFINFISQLVGLTFVLISLAVFAMPLYFTHFVESSSKSSSSSIIVVLCLSSIALAIILLVSDLVITALTRSRTKHELEMMAAIESFESALSRSDHDVELLGSETC